MELNLGKVIGRDGFSPVITVSENSEKSYKLKIETKEETFETPNLKGKDADTNGLSFDQNEEGEWGYIPPGADTVIPFKINGTGEGSKFSGAQVLLDYTKAVFTGFDYFIAAYEG